MRDGWTFDSAERSERVLSRPQSLAAGVPMRSRHAPMPSDQDVYLFREGTLANLHRMLGCHLVEEGSGAAFAVWAPNASAVSVMGDWNGWNPDANHLSHRPDGSGIWEGTLDGVQHGQAYKYRIVTRDGSHKLDKADPVGFLCELPPATASRAWTLDYEWGAGTWM